MFSFSLFLQNVTSPGILDKDDKACSLLACFWKTAFPQAYLTKHALSIFHQADLTKHVLFQLGFAKRHFTRHTCQSLTKAYLTKHVLLQLILQNGISPGILDKHDKACSLSAWFCKTAFHQAYLTKFDKACSLSAYLAKRHFTRHT